MGAFLGNRGVVNDQYRVAAANERVCLDEQFRFQRPGIPDSVGDEMVQLIAFAEPIGGGTAIPLSLIGSARGTLN